MKTALCILAGILVLAFIIGFWAWADDALHERNPDEPTDRE